MAVVAGFLMFCIRQFPRKNEEKTRVFSYKFFRLLRSNWTNGILGPREIPMENDDGHKDLANTAKTARIPTLP